MLTETLDGLLEILPFSERGPNSLDQEVLKLVASTAIGVSVLVVAFDVREQLIRVLEQ